MESSNMNNDIYNKSKIYKIVDVGYSEQYFGSTTVELSTRMARHRSKYNEYKKGKNVFYTSFLLFDKFGLENCKIELVEMYPCDSKEELRKREGYWIKQEECVNKRIAGRTLKEHLEVYRPKYYKENCEMIKEKVKKYKIENEEKIKEYRSETIPCSNCNKLICRYNMQRHLKLLHPQTASDIEYANKYRQDARNRKIVNK